MNRKPIILSSLIAISLALLCCAFVQHARLQELRDQQKRQHETQPAPADNAPAVAQPEPPRVVSPELLKLRNQVSQLTRQRDELAGAGRENERLKAQVASRATNGPASSGYIRKAEAKFSGYDTPEHTLESFLWAVQKRDFEAWLDTMAPELSEPLRKAQQQPGFAAEQFFEGAGAIPGFAVISSAPFARPPARTFSVAAAEGDQLSVVIQIGPNLPTQEMILRLIGGQWKLAQWR
jgi:hypothetical protein